MSRFYLAFWVRWSAAFVLIAATVAAGFATVMAIGSYVYKGFPPLEPEALDALGTIWLFWLGVGYGIGMIGALVGALAFVYRKCIGGYRLVPLNCQGEVLDEIGPKHYFKMWRKWFFALIWVNAAQVIVLAVAHKLLFGGGVWIGWFNPWWLTPMIIVSGLLSLPLFLYRCKNVRITSCIS